MVSFLSLFLIIFIVLLVLSVWWYVTIPSNLPPGLIGLPLLGSILSTWDARNLHKKLHVWTNIYGPLYKFYITNKLVLILGDWNTIHEALVKQGEVFAGRSLVKLDENDDLYGNGLVNNRGETQKTLRRFTLSTLRDFGFGRPILEPRIKEEADQLMRVIYKKNGHPFDPTNSITNAVSNIISGLVFGQQLEDKEFQKLLENSRLFLNENRASILMMIILAEWAMWLASFIPPVRKYNEERIRTMDKFVKNGMENAMKNFDVEHDEPSNFIQAYSKAKQDRGDDDPAFSDRNLYWSILDLFVAGTDTTATTLKWAIFYLLHYQDIQEKVYAEINEEFGNDLSDMNYGDRNKLPFTVATIMETQRLANLLPLSVMHETMEDCRLNGYDIPAGTKVVPLLSAVFNDPKVYSNPSQFDPARFMKTADGGNSEQLAYLIPFSAGKRSCLGESLARMELFYFFTMAVWKFKFTLSPDEPIPSANGEKVGFFRAPPQYKICATPRSP